MAALKLNQRWTWIIASVAMLGGGLVLTFLLVLATQNSDQLEPYFNWLLWGNVATAALLGVVILLALGRLALRLRQRRFGSRLLLKLAGIFGLVGLLPGVLIYTVSYQFVSRSIETWFDVRVEGALEAGLNLGRNTLDNLTQDLAKKTQVAADRLGSSADALPGLLELERLREQLGAQTVSLVSEAGQVEWSAGGSGDVPLMTDRVATTWRQDARQKGVMAQVENLADDAAPSASRIVALAWMPDRSFSLQARGHYLMVTQQLAPEIVRNALNVQAAYSEYQQRALGREGLRRMYIGTLTLALILAVFGAFLLAATLGQQLAHPLLLLAEGVGEVARGDLRPKAIFASKDELGGLTRAFAEMTQQLADARNLVDRSVHDLDSARAHLQAIMDNLTAGVIVFDAQGRIDTVNPGATRILRLPLSVYRGRPLSDVPELQAFAATLAQRFELYAHDPTPGERQQWQESYELQLPGNPEPLTLLVRGADLPPDERLIVFDDLTEVVSAQRAEAWSEVARRVAHEIKNPLTPIQLSAERLQMKLHDKLDEPGQNLLKRSTDTIVTQVQALKTLINEFRDYARLPSAKLVPLDLNALVNDVLALYGQAVEQGTVALDLQPDLPRIMGDPALLRQVVHNLVQNALDAVGEHPPMDAAPRVLLRTDVSLTDGGEVRTVRLAVRDNGPGFPEQVIKRAFEPYITTKAKGTGLGLAVVKKIADEHGALVRIRNLGSAGATPSGKGDLASTSGPSGAQVSLSFSKLSSETPQAGPHYA
ncbi:MAG: PAS domain-containing sensor histidine kinase [Burkholderiales bacterium RIFCSPLOWO2_12_FULL_64_99]|nr:MAG: PAS domain-containing sensor histidine kinase [Burkholderiales bacterium RIFCSPHIGHO2_12_FULL_63_20]OGB64489.1 MAG: PAS domain-containing sensor histidine kinase [Burkholderiales bacterium RIFCSPLOWO2_12_FULL_64_99]